MCSTTSRRFVSKCGTTSNPSASCSQKLLPKYRCNQFTMAKSYDLRNDSSNVSSLLAPDIHDNTSTDNDESEGQMVQKCCIFSSCPHKMMQLHKQHCESCYCRDTPVMPISQLKPRCAKEQRQNDNMRSCHHNFKNSYSYSQIPKKFLNRNHSFVKRIKEPVNLKYTQERSSYENSFHSEKNKSQSSELKLSTDDTILESQSNNENILNKISIKGTDMSYREFKEMSEFRKEKYFECHSVENSSNDAVMQHKCVHKFVVNERLMLEPLNCDSFGISRCEVCSKPMDCCKQHLPQPAPPIRQEPRKSVSAIKIFYEQDLTPPRLNIGSGRERIEIRVPENISRECFHNKQNFKYKKCTPGNSFALRFQKRLI